MQYDHSFLLDLNARSYNHSLLLTMPSDKIALNKYAVASNKMMTKRIPYPIGIRVAKHFDEKKAYGTSLYMNSFKIPQKYNK